MGQNNITALFKVIDLLDSFILSKRVSPLEDLQILGKLYFSAGSVYYYLPKFWTIELFVHIAESLEIEHVLSNHLMHGNHIVWVFELTMLNMVLSKTV